MLSTLVMAERIVFSTKIDRELIKRLKHLAVDMDQKLNDLIEEALREFLKKNEPQSKK
jgi:predicted transcriptional regulator